MTAQTFTGYAIALVAVKRTSGSVAFPLYLVMAIVADEFENSGVNGSGMRSDCVFLNVNFFTWHCVVS
jgi:hypothetical protein